MVAEPPWTPRCVERALPALRPGRSSTSNLPPVPPVDWPVAGGTGGREWMSQGLCGPSRGSTRLSHPPAALLPALAPERLTPFPLLLCAPIEFAILLRVFAEQRPGRAFDDACPSGLSRVGRFATGDERVSRDPADGVGRASRARIPARSSEVRDKSPWRDGTYFSWAIPPTPARVVTVKPRGAGSHLPARSDEGKARRSSMVKVSVEVRKGATRFVVAVRAESIRRAVSLLEVGYSGADLRVKCPIEPEEFFVNDPAARAGIVAIEQPPEGMAA